MKAIGIIGAGAMGTGIAQVASTAGREVRLFDSNPQALVSSRDGLLKILNRQVEKGRMTDLEVKEIFGRIRYIENLSTLGDCDVVIEAIVENLEIKKKVFQELETTVDDETILATNTSSLSVSSIAASCRRPERVLGIHFFNPAPLMPLVEIVPAVQTQSKFVKSAREFVDSWGKLTVQAKDTPGFIVNRIARPFYSEAIKIFEEGLGSIESIDQSMVDLGFRMGPFTLMDYIGHDVNYAVTKSVWQAFYHEPRYKPSLVQKSLVEAGYLGRKAGKGFYTYENGQKIHIGSTESVLSNVEIGSRILCMLINEAADALYLNIASAKDIDLAMTKGVNYPRGLLRWGNEFGLEKVEEQLDNLYKHYHEERYRCSPIIRNMIKANRLF